ncbi:unnamed protein product, partial [Discosporangium mesarthrocarpum]
ERPLFFPCKCRGSIKHVHQDCLVEWLRSRSGGPGAGAGAGAAAPQRCELCREVFVFTARYQDGTPSYLGP